MVFSGSKKLRLTKKNKKGFSFRLNLYLPETSRWFLFVKAEKIKKKSARKNKIPVLVDKKNLFALTELYEK